MNEWWIELTGTEKVFWIIAIPSTIIFLFVLVINLIAGVDGGELDSPDGSFDADMADGIGFQFITFKTLLAFFTIFAWSGIACLDAGFSTTVSVLIATGAGTIMMALTAWFYYFMAKMSESGTLKMSNAVGAIGEVYLTIPSNASAMGKVQIKLQGSLHELDAITDDEEDITRGKLVKVTDVVNNAILKVTLNTNA
jgi:membrane protein implicated in regulation of membrane protease activity